MEDEIAKATDPEVERIADYLFRSIESGALRGKALKQQICSSLYEMQEVERLYAASRSAPKTN
jgi:hypothetical protein